MSTGKYRFSIDRGGTFTDVYAELPDGTHRVMKLLSVDPSNYKDAPREGIRRIISQHEKVEIDKEKVCASKIQWIRMGTTVATNALLERKGERTVFVTTKGFRNLLDIGNQARPHIFDLEIKKPQTLVDEIVEIDERVKIINAHNQKSVNEGENEVVEGTTGEKLEVLKSPNEEEIRRDLQAIYDSGIRSVCVSLVHSYTFKRHEELVGKIAKEIGYTQISLSSHLSPMVKLVPRAQTASVDAYLTPLIVKYMDHFLSGFDEDIKSVDVSFMMSDGGLCPMDHFNGYRSILSGPAGGVVGYAMTTYDEKTKQPVIGFDMGGTSTDVSRYAGHYTHVYDTEIAGVIIQAPQLDIQTVAAGGGSRLFFKTGMFVVGPESSSAHPGPVCYRKGGFLSITDANLLVGRLLPDYFPKIFGPSEKEPLDYEATKKSFEELRAEINEYYAKSGGEKKLSAEEIAMGFIKVANESMCRPIRNITEAKGYDASTHILACFGGAGGQHACAIARSLGMKTVFIHKFAGILSAYGLGLADVVFDSQAPCALAYTDSKSTLEKLRPKIEELKKKTSSLLNEKGFKEEEISTELFLNLRYEGTDSSLMVKSPEDQDFEAAFTLQYKTEYGFLLENRKLLVDDVRVRAVGSGSKIEKKRIQKLEQVVKPETRTKVYFENLGWFDTPVYLLSALGAGAKIDGPSLIIDNTSTIVVEDKCVANITENGDIRIEVGEQAASPIGTELDSIQLSVFANRFMSIAEQMGRTLQRTSISANIKERLDFSCALFGPDGGLVANAPHLPVHLGAMQEAVRWQMNHLGREWKEGEVIVSNHPSAGGSHLPDFTVITPVFHKDKKTGESSPVFYVASRGHHADIGGISPGSMPPFSRSLVEEGACIKSFKLVRDGTFQEKGITDLLMAPGLIDLGPSYVGPKISGTRNLKDNLSDLKAQVAANNKGIHLVSELIEHYGLEVVQAYMLHVQNNAEEAVREMLVEVSNAYSLGEIGSLEALDYMDDGTPIKLKLTIDRKKRTAEFDFAGSGLEVLGNINAPKAVTYSAVIYCLRCLVKRTIPLNQGCLNPITVKIPENSILSPSDTAAVVGGNVLTSQRVTDVILQAFRACGDSQGCMNNFTFGDSTMGYYETIAGGAGATAKFDGANAVQVHMTNTRITDVEILERKYPVLLREFSIREGSGGAGEKRGGNGVVRELEFLKDNFNAGILSERRVFEPKGMNGGENGLKGENLLLKKNGQVVNLTAKNSVTVQTGDRVRIITPGGGGFGAK
eukprot:TRINITY_DN8643_c0_g1_i6.p1 TRINITY_DN8643_c0_g1~~TRINITY_DN8643_c0_g1_i6.p1  ORF type:complete len:1265 (-),score=478.55 TRINITY_DN8643_c0_g1_i6:21-3815(-)